MASSKTGEADLDIKDSVPINNTQQHLAPMLVGQGLNESSHNDTERDLVESLRKHRDEEVEQTFGGEFAGRGLSDSSELVEQM